ncbi:MAG: hypothetical protein JEZ08_00575 [Clostridiales bacterium]|nr:hypothetical protein [Clostridiales bacterium]
MNYIDLYKIQLGQDKQEIEKYYETDIYNEYCGLNCFLNNFERTNLSIRNAIEDVISNLVEEESHIEDCVKLIKNTINEFEKSGHPLFSTYDFDGVLFLIGDMTVDSQGIMIEDKSYMVVDLAAYLSAKDKYNPISFVVHEVVHPIHYKYNPDMYFRHYKNYKEVVLKRMLIEGMATYLTKHFTDESDADIFWLGYLDEIGIKNWINYATDKKESLSKKIKKLIENDELESEYGYLLFSITDPEKLWKGRLAYYYGYDIIKSIHKVKSIDEILSMQLEDFFPHILNYFNIEL